MTYSKDKIDGIDIFQQGQELSLYGDANYKAESYSFGGTISYLIRGNNTNYAGNNLVLSEQQLFGNEFVIRGRADFKVADKWHIQPHAHLRAIAKSDMEESASIFGLGSSISHEFSERVSLGAGLTYYTGNANGGDISLRGVQLSGGLSATF